MYSCNLIADYLLALQGDESEISNLKLQKLVYYAQGYYLAIFDKPLFKERIQAWRHGPVVPELYQRFKDCGAAPIPINGIKPPELDKETTKLLNEVYSVFNQFSASALRNMTHEEKPWQAHEANADEIPLAELQTYFKTRLN